jgi:hypothetical protein
MMLHGALTPSPFTIRLFFTLLVRLIFLDRLPFLRVGTIEKRNVASEQWRFANYGLIEFVHNHNYELGAFAQYFFHILGHIVMVLPMLPEIASQSGARNPGNSR